MKVNEDYLDGYGRSCLVFSGVRKFSDVYDWLFEHYNGYKFCIVLDCSTSEYPEPDNKIYVHFMDELQEEVNLEAGYILSKDKKAYVHR
jgi:ribosomal protein S24E